MTYISFQQTFGQTIGKISESYQICCGLDVKLFPATLRSFHMCFHLEGRSGSIPRRHRNTSRFTATFDSSADSTPNQVGDAITPPSQWSTSRSPFGKCSQQHWPCQPYFGHSGHVTQLSWLLGEAVRHSMLCEFHSCAFCREVSHRELFAKILSLLRTGFLVLAVHTGYRDFAAPLLVKRKFFPCRVSAETGRENRQVTLEWVLQNG